MILYLTAIKNKKFGANLHFFRDICNKKSKKVIFFSLLQSKDYIKQKRAPIGTLLILIRACVRVYA